MTKPVYDMLALTASYLFMALGVAIAICAAAWIRSERKDRKASVPPRGTDAVGYLALVEGNSRRLSKSEKYRVPAECTVGSGRGCDVQLASSEIPGKAARLTLTQSGMLLSPMPGGSVRVNGVDYRVSVMLDEDCLVEWGALAFRLNLYEGACALAAAKVTPPLGGASAEDEARPRRVFRLRRGSPLDAVSADEPAR